MAFFISSIDEGVADEGAASGVTRLIRLMFILLFSNDEKPILLREGDEGFRKFVISGQLLSLCHRVWFCRRPQSSDMEGGSDRGSVCSVNAASSPTLKSDGVQSTVAVCWLFCPAIVMSNRSLSYIWSCPGRYRRVSERVSDFSFINARPMPEVVLRVSGADISMLSDSVCCVCAGSGSTGKSPACIVSVLASVSGLNVCGPPRYMLSAYKFDVVVSRVQMQRGQRRGFSLIVIRLQKWL